MVGWSEEWRVMLNSTQDQIKLKLKFELSLAIRIRISIMESTSEEVEGKCMQMRFVDKIMWV